MSLRKHEIILLILSLKNETYKLQQRHYLWHSFEVRMREMQPTAKKILTSSAVGCDIDGKTKDEYSNSEKIQNRKVGEDC